MKIIARWLVALALLLTAPAYAQSTLLQAGPITPGHSPMYVNSGSSQAVVQDSGPAGGGPIGLGMGEGLYVARGTGTPPYVAQGTGPSGTNWCDYDAPITNATGYHYLCLSPNVGGAGLITYGAGGTATPQQLNISVNGSIYPFPFILSGVGGPSTSVVGHLATWANTTGTLIQDSTVLPSAATATTQTTGDNSTSVATDAFVGASQAQWQVPVHSVPIGLGAGNIGFNAAGPAIAGEALLSTGVSSDPVFLPELNNVMAYKASGIDVRTTGTVGASSSSLAIAASDGFANGQGILVNHAGTAFSGAIAAPASVAVAPVNSSGGATSYCYQLASVDDAGGVGAATTAVCTSSGVAVLGVHSAASLRSFNRVTWTKGTGASFTAIWRNTGGGAYCLLGEFVSSEIDDLVTPCNTSIFWIPSTPTGGSLPDWLQTTVSAGGGTTGLTLATPATSAVTSEVVRHDDTVAIAAAMSGGGTGTFLPCGTYPITSLTAPTNLLTMAGAGSACAKIVGANGINTQIATGLNEPAAGWTTMQFGLQSKEVFNLGVSTLAPMAIGAIYHFGGFSTPGTGMKIHDVSLSGTFGTLCYNNSGDIFGPNIIVSNWWSWGLEFFQCTNFKASNNYIGAMGGEAGGFYSLTVGLVGEGIEAAVLSNHGDISDNWIVPFGGLNGISIQSQFISATDNHIECSTHESIVLDASHVKVSGNFAYWTAASTGGSTPAQCTSDDFGMSASNLGGPSLTDGAISDNKISNSWAPGIELTTSGTTGLCLSDYQVSGNMMNAAGAAGLSAQIAFNGCVTDSTVGENTYVNTLALYDFAEGPAGGGGSPPARNFIGLQNGAAGSTGSVFITSTTTHYLTQPALVAGPSSF